MAARQPHMMSTICGRRFATPRFGVRGGRRWANSIARPSVSISSPLTHGLSLTVFELFSKRFRPSAPDTKTNTDLEATASSSDNNDHKNIDVEKFQESEGSNASSWTSKFLEFP